MIQKIWIKTLIWMARFELRCKTWLNMTMAMKFVTVVPYTSLEEQPGSSKESQLKSVCGAEES